MSQICEQERNEFALNVSGITHNLLSILLTQWPVVNFPPSERYACLQNITSVMLEKYKSQTQLNVESEKDKKGLLTVNLTL